MGAKYGIDLETVSRPRADYQNPDYAATGLPRAPAIAIDGITVVEGRDIDEQELEQVIAGAFKKRCA